MRVLFLTFAAALSFSSYANDSPIEMPPALIGQEVTIEVLPQNLKLSKRQEERLLEVGFLKVRRPQYAANAIADFLKGLGGGESHRARVVAVENEAASSGRGHFSGLASYFGGRHSSRHKAEGVMYTAAHRTLPFGTKVRVTHEGRSVIVLINDRGPFIRGRVIDIDAGAARAIGLVGKGVGRVTCDVM